MALVVADRVKETTTTTGTGTVTLAGAVAGYQAFSVIGNANTTYYAIVAQSGTEWEVGLGTYTSSGALLSRDTVLSSSNAGALVNFSAGTKDVFVTYPAGRSVYQEPDGLISISGTIQATTFHGGSASITNADLASAVIGVLSNTTFTSGSASITTLTGTSADIVTITGTTIGTTASSTLRGISGAITHLNATSATITTLTSGSASITTLTGSSMNFGSILGTNNNTAYTTTATAAGTTVLTSASTGMQYFTGVTTQTVTLPVTSTLILGWSYHIANNSTGNITINSSGGNLVCTLQPGTSVMVTCILTSGTTAASWDAGFTDYATETGSGSVVRATSAVLVTPALGTPTSGNLTNCLVGTDPIGYRNVPITSQSAAYSLVLGDAGDMIFHPSTDANNRTYTIPSSTTVAFPLGTVLSFGNLATANPVTIAIITDTLYLAGTGATGSRTLGAYGIAQATKVALGIWVLTGTAVS